MEFSVPQPQRYGGHGAIGIIGDHPWGAFITFFSLRPVKMPKQLMQSQFAAIVQNKARSHIETELNYTVSRP